MFKSLLSDSLVYGIANLIQKLVPFFVIPLITHQLGETALKIYDISFVYVFLFTSIFILGQDTAVSVFYFDERKTSFNKKQVIGYGLIIQLFVFIIFATFLLFFRKSVAHFIFSADQEIANYWSLALLIIPGYIVLNYVLNILLWLRKRKTYVIICLFQTVLSLASVFIGFKYFFKDLESLFLCIIGSMSFTALVGLIIVRNNISFMPLPVNKTLIKKLILFGVPIAFTYFFQQTLPSIDRFFLLQYGFSKELPQYILAVKMGSLIGLGVGAFVLAFTPYSMSKLNEDDAENDISSLFHIISIIGFVAIPFLLIFKDLMLQVFADLTFATSGKLLPFFFIGWIFDLFTYFSLLGIYRKQSSFALLIFFIIGFIIIAFLNILLIPLLGVYGSAFAFSITKIIMFIIPLFYLRKHFKLKIDFKSFIVYALVSIGCCVLFYNISWSTYCVVLSIIILCTFYYLRKFSFTHILLLNNQSKI